MPSTGTTAELDTRTRRPDPTSAEPRPQGPVLVAVDGTGASLPALHAARLLADRGANVQVISVIEPFPYMLPPAEGVAYAPESDAARVQQLLDQLRVQSRTVLGQSRHAPVDVKVGRPVEVIARTARERHASMVITGLRPHGPLSRMLLHGETPLGIARSAKLPVLAVPERMRHLPRTVLVAVDLDGPSIHAAREARPLLAAAEQVYLVHVQGIGTRSPDLSPPAAKRMYADLIRTMYERVVATLDLPQHVRVEPRSLTGHPVDELLEFSEFAEVDLIVAGYRKRLLFDRLTRSKSVAERLFRNTRCAIFLAPGDATLDLPFGLDVTTDVVVDRTAWQVWLAAFTSRNIGRPTHLEIDTDAVDVQAQIIGYPLLGITYDEAGDTLQMSFGNAPPVGSQLSHTIAAPRALEFQRARGGPDAGLRVAYDNGFSLLTFRGSPPAAMG